MNWDRLEGDWKQLRGKAKEKWGRLTDDDLTAISGRRAQLEGKIQERYGYAKSQARKEIEDWYRSTESHLADEIDKIIIPWSLRLPMPWFLCSGLFPSWSNIGSFLLLFFGFA